MTRTSAISAFYKLAPSERVRLVQEFSQLNDEEVEAIHSMSGLKIDLANRMIENVVGGITLPLGIATNFLINGKDYIIPMALEEPSVVAAASNAARMARVKGGYHATTTSPIMIGQVQTVKVKDPYGARMRIIESKSEILEKANAQDPLLVSLGGGAKDLEAKVINTLNGPMLIVELQVDCRDAMGANAVNTMAEAIAPLVERISGGKVLLRIISNLATKRLARARAVFDKDTLGGEEVVDAIMDAYAFAAADSYRCATHNKGIMNGVVAVGLATSQDVRALEAGAHAYAARSGKYLPLSTWEKNEDGDLVGTLEMPMAVGVIGGATAVHPVAKACRKILGVKTANEMAEVIVSVGLGQNLAALRALASEGIQKGHMKLHARNIAVMAGATGEQIDLVAEKLVEEKKVRIDRAKEILEGLPSR